MHNQNTELQHWPAYVWLKAQPMHETQRHANIAPLQRGCCLKTAALHCCCSWPAASWLLLHSVSAVLWSNTLLLLVLLLLLLSASCLRISLSSYNASSSVCSCLLGLLINVPVDLEQTKLAPRVSLACANAQVGVGRDLALELLLWVDEYIVDEYSDGQRSDSVEA